MIPVTKPYMRRREKLDRSLDGIYERQWLTNKGPLVQELTRRLEDCLGVKNLLLVSNGTLALQVSYRVLEVTDRAADERREAITTPFSFHATKLFHTLEGEAIIFKDEARLERAKRRHANDVAGRIICLPIYIGLTDTDVAKIVRVVEQVAL